MDKRGREREGEREKQQIPTTEIPIIRKGPTTRSGSRVIRAGFAKAVQELLAQEQTGFKQLLIQELADLKLKDTSEPLEAPDSIHSKRLGFFRIAPSTDLTLVVENFLRRLHGSAIVDSVW
ncbi:hypothetical protein DY000_02020127 [Brassica cretica]|uniref:Uncharacterized protein n=1 Tax=Brassica cretica TaxID=69181 RepID=A0ABQ7E1V9_BRACR|nr:hypothetical protein DY000_02020127 [Brassica cretica]